MRRTLILALLLGALVGAGGTAAPTTAQAAEGNPDDYCSYSPDYPFGWSFNDACRGHDECLFDLSDSALLPDRLDCDDTLLDDLLAATHLDLDGVCEESRLCNFLAGIYHRVVRFVTLLSWGAVDLPSPSLPPPSPLSPSPSG